MGILHESVKMSQHKNKESPDGPVKARKNWDGKKWLSNLAISALTLEGGKIKKQPATRQAVERREGREMKGKWVTQCVKRNTASQMRANRPIDSERVDYGRINRKGGPGEKAASRS